MENPRLTLITGAPIFITGEKEVGDWKFKLGSERILHGETKRALESIVIQEFPKAYTPDYPYWFLNETGFPSPIIRIDFSPTVAKFNPRKSIYEIEARPAGLGIMTEVFGQKGDFLQLVQQLEQSGKKVGTKVCPSLLGNHKKKDRREDTKLFVQSLGLPFFDSDEVPPDLENYLLWVRGGLEDEQQLSNVIADLEGVALAPVRDHGNKKYLINMGLAAPVDLLSLDFTRSFCVKPLKGSKSQGICLWDPNNKRVPGISSRSRIEKVLQDSSQQFIVQPLISPELIELNGHIYDLIYRVFAILDLKRNAYKIIGGIYTARPNLIVHGANDAVMGLIRA